MEVVKKWLPVGVGGFSAVLSWFFGEWNGLFSLLCVCMIIDYVSGLLVALVFQNSPKTKQGGLSSNTAIQGLFRKTYMLILVGVANLLDVTLGVGFIRTGLIACFASGELLSIIENAGLMGIKIPGVLEKALEILKEMGESNNE